MEKVQFLSGGQRIDGTLFRPQPLKDHNPGVIFFHGMTSSEQGYLPIAERLAHEGIVGLTLSIRAHGTSEGDFNALKFSDALADGLAAYDFFAQYDFVDSQRIALCGASLGASIAAMVSAQRRVESLVLRVPATYTKEMMQLTYTQIMADEGQIFKKITNISDTPPVRAVSQFTGDLLIVTSEHDAVIPVSIPTQYLLDAHNARTKQMIQIDGAEHALTGETKEKFIAELVQWLVKTL